MSSPEELVGLARDLAEGVVEIAGDLLSVGVDIVRVQGRYVAAAVELLADAEILAVQAVDDDGHALTALARTTRALADLREEAKAEFNRSRGP